MKKNLPIISAVIVLLLSAACDLINPSTIDTVMQGINRDNPLDYDFWAGKSSLDLGDHEIIYPVTFTADGKGYAGLGTMWADEPVMNRKLYMYDPDTDAWSPRADYPGTGKQSGIAFVLNNEVYITGGNYHDSALNEWFNSYECWKYIPAADEWVELASIPDQGSDTMIFNDLHVSTVYNGKFYLQSTGSIKTFVYDPAADSWTENSTTSAVNGYYSSFFQTADSDTIYYVLCEGDFSDVAVTASDGSSNTISAVTDFSFNIFYRNFILNTTIDQSMYSSNFSSSMYSSGLRKWDANVYSIPKAGLFTISDKLYMFSQEVSGTSLIRFSLNGTDAAELLDWPSGLKSDASDGWCTYPIIFEDRAYFLDQAGNFYMYKP